MFSVRNNMVCRRGFTLVEVMMGVLVSSIIFGAIGTLAFAMSSAHEQTKDMSEMQAYIRYTSDRLRDEMRQSVKVWIVSNVVVFWRGDLNADDQINGNELLFLETSVAADVIRIVEFPANLRSVTVDMIENGSAESDIIANGSSRMLTLIPVCSNVLFELSVDKRLVNISFDLSENGRVTSYDICGALVGSAENIFKGSGGLRSVSGD